MLRKLLLISVFQISSLFCPEIPGLQANQGLISALCSISSKFCGEQGHCEFCCAKKLEKILETQIASEEFKWQQPVNIVNLAGKLFSNWKQSRCDKKKGHGKFDLKKSYDYFLANVIKELLELLKCKERADSAEFLIVMIVAINAVPIEFLLSLNPELQSPCPLVIYRIAEFLGMPRTNQYSRVYLDQLFSLIGPVLASSLGNLHK